MTYRDGERARRRRAEREDPGWEYLAGMSQRETAREMALRKATVGVIWKAVRAKVAAILEETG